MEQKEEAKDYQKLRQTHAESIVEEPLRSLSYFDENQLYELSLVAQPSAMTE